MLLEAFYHYEPPFFMVHAAGIFSCSAFSALGRNKTTATELRYNLTCLYLKNEPFIFGNIFHLLWAGFRLYLLELRACCSAVQKPLPAHKQGDLSKKICSSMYTLKSFAKENLS